MLSGRIGQPCTTVYGSVESRWATAAVAVRIAKMAKTAKVLDELGMADLDG